MTQRQQENTVVLCFSGDVMLGRLADEKVSQTNDVHALSGIRHDHQTGGKRAIVVLNKTLK